MIKKLNKNLIIGIGIVAVVLLSVAVLIYFNQGGFKKLINKGGEVLSAQQIAEKSINYLNQNILPPGNAASLIEVVDAGDVFKIRLKIDGTEYTSYASKDGKFLFPEGYELDATSTNQTQNEDKETIGSFLVSKNEICKENEKPIVYFFGSEGCSHCVWEKPIMGKVANDFEGYISFHNNIDSDADSSVFFQYSDGGIPTLVFGCKYYRVGSGEQAGEESETKVLTALLCKLTGNQPSNVCSAVQDLINQIE